MFEAIRGSHDRLLAHLATAGRRSRALGSTCVIPDPLAIVLRELSADELAALEAIVEGTGGHGPYVHTGLGAPYPPIRRLLEPFLDMRRAPATFAAHAHARAQISNRLRATDAEAFQELVSALETERAARG